MILAANHKKSSDGPLESLVAIEIMVIYNVWKFLFSSRWVTAIVFDPEAYNNSALKNLLSTIESLIDIELSHFSELPSPLHWRCCRSHFGNKRYYGRRSHLVPAVQLTCSPSPNINLQKPAHLHSTNHWICISASSTRSPILGAQTQFEKRTDNHRRNHHQRIPKRNPRQSNLDTRISRRDIRVANPFLKIYLLPRRRLRTPDLISH